MLEKIVVLIDADNTQVSKLKLVLQTISSKGRIVVKRAYGNWRNSTLNNWEDTLKELAIKAEQQFDYVKGKNATDMALTIDALKLLYNRDRNYDGFVIVSSDSDFTPLAMNLHESGVYVIGVGEKKTPTPFRNSCDEFIFLENLDASEVIADDIEVIHELLKVASNNLQDDEGFVYASSAGNFLKRAKPDFDIRSYGYDKLGKMLSDFPDRYETKLTSDEPPVLLYKCLQ